MDPLASEKDLRKRHCQLDCLSRLGQLAGECHNLDQFLQPLVKAVAQTCAADFSAVTEIVDDTCSFYRAGFGWPEGIIGRTFVENESQNSLTGYTLRGKKSVIVFDMRAETRFQIPEHLRAQNIISCISVIIGRRTAPFGVLFAASTSQRLFDVHDAHFLESLASMISEFVRRQKLEAMLGHHELQDPDPVKSRQGKKAEITEEINPECGKAEQVLTGILMEDENLQKQQREFANQLNAVNRELDSFSYSISHDLHAPLRAINGFARILVEDYREILPDEARRLLDRVQVNATQMSQMLDKLLYYSRLSRLPLINRRIIMRDLVHRVLADFHWEQENRHLEIIVATLPDCIGDQSLLKTVLRNLIDNALKFSRVRDPAKIEIGMLPGDQGSTQIKYFIKDNGVGFDLAYADKLFGIFQRLHRMDAFEGYGVGLAVVKRIVERWGGRVTAEAEVDKGATFYFTIKGVES